MIRKYTIYFYIIHFLIMVIYGAIILSTVQELRTSKSL